MIRPVNSVSFSNNYNHVNFAGKKEKKSCGMHISSSLKAIPLATMIAMSPLNNISAQSSSSCPETVIFSGDSPNGLPDNRPCSVYFVSNDCDDSNAEAIQFMYEEKPVTLPRTVNGVKKNFKFSSIVCLRPDKAEIVKSVAKYKNKPDVVTYEYIFSGGGMEIFKPGVAADGSTYGSEKQEFFDHKKVSVRKEVFNQCIEILNGNLEVTRRTEEYDGDATEELENLYRM